jgi:hypothetical protein
MQTVLRGGLLHLLRDCRCLRIARCVSPWAASSSAHGLAVPEVSIRMQRACHLLLEDCEIGSEYPKYWNWLEEKLNVLH